LGESAEEESKDGHRIGGDIGGRRLAALFRALGHVKSILGDW
jgi:hypothetical protein